MFTLTFQILLLSSAKSTKNTFAAIYTYVDNLQLCKMVSGKASLKILYGLFQSSVRRMTAFANMFFCAESNSSEHWKQSIFIQSMHILLNYHQFYQHSPSRTTLPHIY